MSMRTTGKLCLFVFVLVAPALAQNSFDTGPSPAARGPAYSVSAGYAYLTMPMPGAGRVNLNGFDVAGDVDFTPHWGATLDSNYARTSNVLGTHHDGYLLSFYTGPAFYPVAHGNTRMFVRGLAGVGIVDGAVPIATVYNFHGYQTRPSYAAGGGIERSIAEAFAVRMTGDYLRTGFFDAAGAVQPQNNFRVTVSFVFRVKERHPRAAIR